MAAPIAVFKLLQQLLKKTALHSKNFDNYQTSFLKKLQSSPSAQETEELYNECIEQLELDKEPLKENLSAGRLVVTQSQLQLQKIESLPTAIKQKIEQSMGITPPYSILEHQSELTNIIKIYQRVVLELNKNKATESNNKPENFECLSDELQQLILDLDINDAYLKQLESIRLKIASENNPLALPQHCLTIIAIIVDSTREERRSSRHFLYTLNDSLTQFYLNFANNIKRAEKAFEDQDVCVKSIQKKSERLKTEAEKANDINSLRANIFSYVASVEDLIKAKESEKEQQVNQQLKGMVRQIKELQNETKNYQTTLKKQNKQLHIDFLTQIPNRAAWSERLQIEFTRYQRYQNPLNIAVIDIDKFKSINDTFGHLAGDKVLNVIAQTLQKSIRNADFIARYGGEEFALLLPDITPEQAKMALEKLCKSIKVIPFKFKKENICITISIGCTALTPEDDIETAFERADQGLYTAKNSGRNQVILAPK